MQCLWNFLPAKHESFYSFRFFFFLNFKGFCFENNLSDNQIGNFFDRCMLKEKTRPSAQSDSHTNRVPHKRQKSGSLKPPYTLYLFYKGFIYLFYSIF